MALFQQNANVIPGIDQALESLNREIFWGLREVNKTWIMGVQLDGRSRDPGNTPDTILRPGLTMGFYTDVKTIVPWTYDGTGANMMGFLLYAEQTQKLGADQNKWFGYIAVGGQVRTKDVIINGAPVSVTPTYTYGNLAGSDDEATLRTAWTRFVFDDFAEQFTTTEP